MAIDVTKCKGLGEDHILGSNPNQIFGLGRETLPWKADKVGEISYPHETRTPTEP